MTGRERIVAAARGGETDVRPTLSALGGGRADAVAVPPAEVPNTIDENPDCAVLAEVRSPLGLALSEGTNIVSELHNDIDRGTEILNGLVNRTRSEIQGALHQGADGVFYILDGAYPGITTPMEYGGHFLELDRQLLTEAQDARFNVLFVCGEEEPYIDFVSDLPAHAFAWDPRSKVESEYVRSMRHGALAADEDGAEIRLVVGAAQGAAS